MLKTSKVYLKNVIVYTKQNCKWCVLVKGLLKRIGIEYKEIEVSDSDFESFKQKFNVKLPQVTSNSQLIGGYTKLWEIFSPQVDYDLLKHSKIITFNLNKIIDINFYPIESAKRSNMKL